MAVIGCQVQGLPVAVNGPFDLAAGLVQESELGVDLRISRIRLQCYGKLLPGLFMLPLVE